MNGKCDLGACASAYAKVLVACVNHLARCLVVPWRMLVEQGTERIQPVRQQLFGVGGTGLFLLAGCVMQIAALVIVQKEDLALVRA